jgi:hypothetical protein
MTEMGPRRRQLAALIFSGVFPGIGQFYNRQPTKGVVSLAKTSSDSLRSTEICQSVHRPKTPSLVGGRATGIVRPSALHGHTGVAREDGERAGWEAELDL